MKRAFWILTLGAIPSAVMAATLSRAADFSEAAEVESGEGSGAEDAR